MSYLVLARKWRPQTFDDVVGQPHVTKTLQNAIRSGRIAHAYLFTGARGVGKTSVARILAKSLNCEREALLRPCNQCSNCREITQGNSVDVLEIDGASNRGIDNIRELRETVRYRPAKSPLKIYTIDEVHMLTTEAFNALLKTLEEPPAHVLFLFATTEPHKIPSTILSRCQRFDFRRISTQQIVKHLSEMILREEVNISDAVLFAVAREADGSMRDAQSLLEQLLTLSGDGLGDDEVLDVLGVVDRRSVHRVAQAILTGDVRACLEVVSDLYRRGIDSRRFCQQLCDHFRNLLFISYGEGDGSVQMELPEGERKALVEEAARTTSESLFLYFQMVLRGEEEIRRSSLPRITLEMLLLRMTQLPRLESLDTVIHKLALLDERLSCSEAPKVDQLPPTASASLPDNKPAEAIKSAGKLSPRELPAVGPSFHDEEPLPPPQAIPVHHSAILPSTAAEAVEHWERFLQWVTGRDPVLAAKLNQSRIGLIAENTLELEVLEVFEHTLEEPQALAKLVSATSAFFGQEFQWTVRGRSLEQGKSGSPDKPKSRKASARRKVLEHPMVQAAMEILSGELVEIKHLKGLEETA